MADDQLHLDLVTPAGSVFEGEIKRIRVPGTSGSFEVLRQHAPIVSTLEEGRIDFEKADGTRVEYSVSGGVIEVLDNKVVLLAEAIGE